jgi:proteasome assembly chaperone (PAC2) family protein
MKRENIELKYLPKMENALLIACFEGWGNALNVSMGMAEYLIRKLEADPFARLEADPFYAFKESRPIVEVEDGILKNLTLPACEFYAVGKERIGRDMIILKGEEPDLKWFPFTDSILELGRKIGVKTVISCGGMLDHILPSELMISVVASSRELLDELQERRATLINYKGQSSIHSTLHFEAKKRGFDCIGLYCHCPYYLQGITHFGLLAHLGRFLSGWAGFDLDTTELSSAWKEMSAQIQEAVNNNPELENIVSDIKKSRGRKRPEAGKKEDKVIKLEDYFRI